MGGLIGCVVSVLFGLVFIIFGIMFINYNSETQSTSRMLSGVVAVMSVLFGLCGCGLTMFGI